MEKRQALKREDVWEASERKIGREAGAESGMRRIWHWLKGHQWRVWETYCDGHTHYINGNHYTVTHILLQCTECGWVKSKDVLGAYTLKKKDTLAEAISYLEKK